MIGEFVQPIIPATGYGKICGGKPKILAELVEGLPMIEVLIEAVYGAGMAKAVVILNPLIADQVQPLLPKDATVVIHPDCLGTAPAVELAMSHVCKPHVMILFADMPLWRPATLVEFAETHLQSGKKMTMMSISAEKWNDDNARCYGRIAKDGNGNILGIYEPTDSLPEMAAICSVNPSMFCFDADELPRAIAGITHLTDKGEKTINSVVYHYINNGGIKEYPLKDHREALGVNDDDQWLVVSSLFHERILSGWPD